MIHDPVVVAALANREIQVFLRDDRDPQRLQLIQHYTRCPFDNWETAAAIAVMLQNVATELDRELRPFNDTVHVISVMTTVFARCLHSVGYNRVL